jgi:hypothetical protein
LSQKIKEERMSVTRMIQVGADKIDDLRNIKPIATEVIWVPYGASLLPYLQAKVLEVSETMPTQAFSVSSGFSLMKGSNPFTVDFYDNIPEEILKKWEEKGNGKKEETS